jgi:phosphonate transport system substrate-binding protein
MSRFVYRAWGLIMVLSMILAACVPATPTAGPAATPTAEVTEELGTEKRPLINVFVPSGDVQAILAGGERLDEMLKSKYGIVTKSSVATSYTAAIEALCSGKADIVWLATLSYVLAHDKCDAQILLMSIRRGSPTYKGQILVGVDSGINSLADLRGKKFAFTDPVSTSGYLYAVGLLKKNGIDPEKDLAQAVFAGSHNAAALAVYRGAVDAAATFVDVRDQLEKDFPDIKEKTKVIATTDPIPNDTITVRKDLPPAVVEKFKQAMLDLVQTEEGRQIVFDIYEWDGAVEGDDSLFEPVRQAAASLGIELRNWKGVSVPYKVALVTSIEGVGAGLNKGVWAGIQKAMADTSAGAWVEGAYIEPKDAAEYEGALTQAAEGGNDLVFAVGSDMADAVKAVAKQHPKVAFVLVGYAYTQEEFAELSNVTSLIFEEATEEAVADESANAIKNFRRAILKPGIIEAKKKS